VRVGLAAREGAGILDGGTHRIRVLPRLFIGLANTTATLGSFYWLGFETTGLSPDKKRLAYPNIIPPSSTAY
jgi:hypothetical protein